MTINLKNSEYVLLKFIEMYNFIEIEAIEDIVNLLIKIMNYLFILNIFTKNIYLYYPNIIFLVN
jgi:hypothetical protein